MEVLEKSHGKRLVEKLVCPNCWFSFPPEDVLFIAKHPELIGDSIAGENELMRFLPNRFTVNGEAIDPKGFPSSEIACPKCHLQVAEAMLEVPPFFVSFVGAPASGKSYYLTAMTWNLRRIMPQIGLSFTDADPIANVHIQKNEHTLFLNPEPNSFTEIPKTQTDDPRLHKTILIDDVPIRFPIPLQFTLWPTPKHPKYKKAHEVGRILVLYDNAGEDFLPSLEGSSSAVVQHLAKSKLILMLFDPTQDPRFRSKCQSDDPQLKHGIRPGVKETIGLVRQETLLREMAVRMRRYLKLSQSDRIKKPLLIILPKFDVWGNMTDISIDEEPYTLSSETGNFKMDLRCVERVSRKLKKLMSELCPEFVAIAENLSKTVGYIPVSSLGHSPSLVKKKENEFYGICPKDIKPKWVTVPLLYSLCKWAPVTMGNVSCMKKS